MKALQTILLTAILITVFCYCQNNMLTITRLNITSGRLPQGFNGYRIVHLSDLHNKEFGRNNSILISAIKSANPELIVITGDLIDSGYYNENSIVDFMVSIRKIAQVYYVTGNHEVGNRSFALLEQKLRKNGITVLRDSSCYITRNGDTIQLAGIDDPIFTSFSEIDCISKYLDYGIKKSLGRHDTSIFKILLSHRPEQSSLYADYKFDLIFSGHAHGGQIRLPFIGGLVAPGQGIFPKYTSGKYLDRGSVMIVSRGLGNGSFPQRIFNRPEIILAVLSSEPGKE